MGASPNLAAERIPTIKPRLRGVSHQWACLASLPLGATLIVVADTAVARTAVSIYAATLTALFGVSAAYHRVDWRSLSARRWMRRLDHSMIFVFIAGTYTPIALLALHGPLAVAILATIWGVAALGVGFKLAWIDAPKWLASLIYVVMGWAVVAAFPQIASAVGVGGLTLVLLSGVLYTVGALIYAAKRPDPVPTVFGYHEVFHALVIAAAALQYAVVAFYVL
jgi:hemolysin III